MEDNTINFDDIFTAYYSQFRADSDVPTSTDDEYTVGLRLANEAIRYWENYDGVLWNELFTTNQTDGTGAQTAVTGQATYTVATNFKKAGGYVRILSTTGGNAESYEIIEPHEAQFRETSDTYAFFTGNMKTGHTLHLNPAPRSELNGLDIEYVYYKSATLFTTGTDETEMSNPYFIVHRVLANQFRASRNPYYVSAQNDASYAIKTMQIDNSSGNWASPPTMSDTSSTSFGA